jgi:hypothetical protein
MRAGKKGLMQLANVWIKKTTTFAFVSKFLHAWLQSLSIEEGGGVPYRYIVTILRLASMQYITKLATT